MFWFNAHDRTPTIQFKNIAGLSHLLPKYPRRAGGGCSPDLPQCACVWRRKPRVYASTHPVPPVIQREEAELHHFQRSFEIASCGVSTSDLAGLAKELDLFGQVVITGYVNDVQLSTIYAHTRLLVMPSLYERFGLPLVEAMSFGVPVLTSDRSSMPEVAGDAEVLVDPFNVHSIARGLSSLLCNDLYRDQLASTAIRNAKRFTWQNAARDMWAVFEGAAEARAQRIGRSEQ